eukprot:TRINITY_DN2785_c0_g1_i1.p1 TRINITY_DN2785_c0_g1~~TRINITY_DN2785_c0_g1_i1.p1  ORF type:complete len:112 (+),score=4.21 TRINITY_DN2785_c0_g1_i1:319-654(+)
MLQFFNIESREGKSLTFDELVRILLSIYFIFFRLQSFRNTQRGKDHYGMINLEQFIELIGNSTFYLKFPLHRNDVIGVFRFIDTDNDGWITYRQYIDFILKYLGKDCLPAI